jgi:hypothetical protein
MADGELIPFPQREEEPESADTSYEVALDDEPDGVAEPVHDGEAVAQLPLDGERRPVIPAALQSITSARAEVLRLADVARHHGSFHAIRSPWYLLKTFGWALWGSAVLSKRLIAYLGVSEQAPLRSLAVISGDAREYRSLHAQAKKLRDERRIIAGLAAFGVALAVTLLIRFAPHWAWALTGVAALVALARAGRPADRRIITPSMITPRFRVISADTVLRAYYRAGLGDPAKEGEEVTFGSPMSRDGDGSRVVVDLPYGRTLKEAMDARERLASGLDVQVSQVFINRDPTSNRRHTLWVADRDPLAAPAGPTPLLACKQTDIWKPAPLGPDERGQLIAILMMWHSFLFGGMPRQGKTWSARLLALFAALDPYVKLDVFDASGKPDWRKFALIADSCAFGLTPTREGKPPEILLATLLGIKEDVEDRYNRLSEMPTSVCPQGKLTRQIARDPRYRMPVRLLILDEVQEYFLLGEISKLIAELLVYLVKVAPGAGVIVLDGTQRPSGIGTGIIQSQFVNFRDQHQVKFALRTASWKVSDLVLGDGAYSAGLDSSILLPDYKGVGILRGAMDASPTVRCYTADDEDAEKILLAARALRQRAGTLSGMAAGVEVEQDERDVLADVLQVFSSDPKLQWEVLAARLAAQIPDRWADTSPDAVSAEVRGRGVPGSQVWQFGKNRQGCLRADVAEALARAGQGAR